MLQLKWELDFRSGFVIVCWLSFTAFLLHLRLYADVRLLSQSAALTYLPDAGVQLLEQGVLLS